MPIEGAAQKLLMELTPYCRAEQQATKARSGATQSSCPGKSGASCSGAVPSTSAGFIAGDAMRCHVVPSCVAILQWACGRGRAAQGFRSARHPET